MATKTPKKPRAYNLADPARLDPADLAALVRIIRSVGKRVAPRDCTFIQLIRGHTGKITVQFHYCGRDAEGTHFDGIRSYKLGPRQEPTAETPGLVWDYVNYPYNAAENPRRKPVK